MPRQRQPKTPLTGTQLARRGPLPPTAPAPPQITIHHGRVHVPTGASARLVAVEGADELYRVEVTMPTAALGTPNTATIPVDLLSAAPTNQRAPGGPSGPGHRPPHLAVESLPSLPAPRAPRPPKDPARGIPTGIFGPDERQLLATTHFPWCTVGRIDTACGTGTGCTIGPRLLLTANHLIAWNADGTAGWLRFRPAYDLGKAPFGEAWATRILAWGSTTPADGMTGQEVGFDYAICVLDTPIGDLVGYPGYRTYDPRWNGGRYWQHLGYPSDLAASQRPAYQGDLHIASVGPQHGHGQLGYVLGHFSDIVPGHSGGPLWGWWPDDPWPTIVGLQSSQAFTPAPTQAGDNECSGGPALSFLIAHARERYP